MNLAAIMRAAKAWGPSCVLPMLRAWISEQFRREEPAYFADDLDGELMRLADDGNPNAGD